jgi:tRNA(Ile)-lysidine synthase
MPSPDLRPDDLLHQVEAALRKAGLCTGDGIVVAVSGGVDSVVLLDVMHRLSPALQLHLHVAHLDHGLRLDSAADASFVADLAQELGLPATIEAMDVAAVAKERRLSPEHAGRLCRRQLWERTRSTCGARFVVVGHHADDQAETVLLRLLRGAGTTGLGAIRPVVDACIVRPMLSVRRQKIEAYALSRGLEVREDPTNTDLQVPRNRVRHELIPALTRRHNPALVEGLGRTARLLQADDDYLEQASQEAVRSVLKVRQQHWLKLDTVLLRGYHIALQRRVLRQYIQEFAQYGQFSFSTVERLLESLAGDHGLQQIAAHIWAESTSTELIIRLGELHYSGAIVQEHLKFPGDTSVPGRDLMLRSTVIDARGFAELQSGLGPWRAAFDAEATTGCLQLRTPRPGDRLRPLGMRGRHKKLSDCLIDAKWPRILRSDTLLLTRTAVDESEEVLWIAGLIRSEAFRVTSETDRILYLEFVEARSSEPGAANSLTDGPMT